MKTIKVHCPEDYVEWRCNECHKGLGFCVHFYPDICAEPKMYACPIFSTITQRWKKVKE